MARIDIGKDSNGEDKNDIRQAVTRDHKEYAAATAGNARFARRNAEDKQTGDARAREHPRA